MLVVWRSARVVIVLLLSSAPSVRIGASAFRISAPIVPKDSNADGEWQTVSTRERKPEAPRYVSGPRNWFSILSWNVENMGESASSRHKLYINAALEQLIEDHRPDIIVLQEVENCGLVQRAYKDMGDYRCVGSVVPAWLERKIKPVLGNVLIYRADLFVASSLNQVLRKGYEYAAHEPDVNGRTLFQHHQNLCPRWQEYNGCHDPFADMPDATTVNLMFRPKVWKPGMKVAFPGGLRVVNIHLFSGGRQDISNSSRHERRAFQLRSLFALIHAWNKNWTVDMGSAPTTLYAGDYNTRGRDEIGMLAKSSVDYGVDVWCPVDNGLCSKVPARRRTHRSGFLDNVVVDVQPSRSRARLGAWGLVLDQPFGSGKSDHNPILLKLESPEPSKPKKPAMTTTTTTTTSSTSTTGKKKKKNRRRRRKNKGQAEVEDDLIEAKLVLEDHGGAKERRAGFELELDEVSVEDEFDEPTPLWDWATSKITDLYSWLMSFTIEREAVLLSDGELDDF